MDIRYVLRFACFGFAAALCSLTMATSARASYFDADGGTTLTTATSFNAVIVLAYADYQPAFRLSAIAEHERIASDHHPVFRHSPIKERASRSAVRPTAISGWRSGRIRTLAAC